MSESNTTIDPELLKAVKAQVLEELKDEQTRKMEESKAAREAQRTEYENYVAKMKDSPEPWVDVTGWSETDKGVKVELDWNDAFVDYLHANGIHSTDDEQTVQKWVTLLLRDMADQMEDRFEKDGSFE